jgi:hypothetical protein
MEIVRRDSIPASAPAIMRLRNIVEFRSDGTAKCRTVVVGSRETHGEHYLNSASPMVMAETVLMIISLVAVAGMLGEQFDFYMAFTQSDCEEPDQYIELPDIPAPLLAEYPDLGPGRGGAFVGRLLMELYGRHYASRAFSLCVRERLEEMGKIEGVRITIFTCERCAFSMSWNDHHLLDALHSDDGIFFCTSLLISNKFVRLLEDRFILETGPVDVYCGLEIDYQPEQRMARIRQTRHIDIMLKIFRMSGTRPERFPLPTGRPGELAAQRWTGEATERSHFDYAMFIGDLVWVTKTRFDLKHAAHILAQQMRNPGPHQIHAAKPRKKQQKEKGTESPQRERLALPRPLD